MFTQFTDFLNDVASKGQESFARLKDKATFNRMVLACFLIARADGTFCGEEKTALAKLIQQKLPHYKIDDILAAITAAEAKLDFDVGMGTQELMAEIAKAKGEDAQSIIRAACYIGASDGDFDDQEKAITRTLCERMGLKPSHYGL